MKRSVKVSGKIVNLLYVMAIASFTCELSTSFMAFAQPTNPAPSYTPTPKLSSELSVEELAKRKAWRENMAKTPTPKYGCFKSTYPNTQWEEVPCTTAPDRPYPRAVGPRQDIVGGGGGFAAQAAGSISDAVGFFDSATSTISETGGANNFSLQLNTNQFNTASCTPPAPVPASPSCQGWQQFIYSNSGSGFIQYWLLGYFDNRPTCTSDCCPSGWNTFKPTASIPGAPGCWRNSDPQHTVKLPVVTLTATALIDLQLTGRVRADTDTVTVATGPLASNIYTATAPTVLNLANNWQIAEFNIFGDGNSSQVNFIDGSTIDVRIDVGGFAACAAGGFTAETNNLTLVPPCCTYTTDSPGGGGIMFTESNAAGAKSRCDQGPHCLPLGASCSVPGEGCCATFGEAECRNNVCVRRVPPPSCNGRPTPTQACGVGWHCCDTDGWICGQCR